MDRQKLLETQMWAREELERSVNFWLEHGMDKENGGVYTCLDRRGEIYSTDKSVWMQGRCGWLYAFLCHTYGTRLEWLEASRSCLDFMEAHCFNHEAGDRMYFTVTAGENPCASGGTTSPRRSAPLPTLNIISELKARK